MNFLQRNKMVISGLTAVLFVVLAVFRFGTKSSGGENSRSFFGFVWCGMAVFYGIDFFYERREKKLERL